jgi:hypothetical protein
MKLLLLPLAWLAPACAATWYVAVAGLGGLPEYDSRFLDLAKSLEKSLRADPRAHVEMLAGLSATREQLRAALAKARREAQPEDELVVILIGHGTYDGTEYKFNLPGPDVTGTELAEMLAGIKTARQLVVNTTSASGGAIEALRRENRVVISATRTGTEKNATVFARYFVDAFRDPSADTDKNDAVSALEAFRFADQRTAKFYETQKRLATEHAVLEDTGKGDAVRVPSAENGQGLLAARFTLLRLGAAQSAARTPEKQKLLFKKEELEGQIEKLKYEKAAMSIEEYRKKLEALLVELAKTQEDIDK